MLTGRRLRRLTNFQKTVMCVRVVADIGPPSAEDDRGGGSATRMFAASLDGHLKVFDCNDFQVTTVRAVIEFISSHITPPLAHALSVQGPPIVRLSLLLRNLGVHNVGNTCVLVICAPHVLYNTPRTWLTN
eukprot:724076-Prorocentrum_minimum.AAC.1